MSLLDITDWGRSINQKRLWQQRWGERKGRAGEGREGGQGDEEKESVSLKKSRAGLHFEDNGQ